MHVDPMLFHNIEESRHRLPKLIYFLGFEPVMVCDAIKDMVEKYRDALEMTGNRGRSPIMNVVGEASSRTISGLFLTERRP
jgi:hypothetical protein